MRVPLTMNANLLCKCCGKSTPAGEYVMWMSAAGADEIGPFPTIVICDRCVVQMEMTLTLKRIKEIKATLIYTRRDIRKYERKYSS